MEKVQRTAGTRLPIVDQAEDRRVRPDPQCEDDHRRKSESRRFADAP
jgi:hypothetical protein